MQNDDQKPPRVRPSIPAAPKIRQLFWCDFPKDAQLPEFWKRRPVIILTKNPTLAGAVTVVPCSSQPQRPGDPVFKLTTTLGQESWAICDKITTVAVSRLTATPVIPRLPQEEFDAMLAVVLAHLPRPSPPPTGPN